MWSKLWTFFFLSFFQHFTHSCGLSSHTISNISVSFHSFSIRDIFFFDTFDIGFCFFGSDFFLSGVLILGENISHDFQFHFGISGIFFGKSIYLWIMWVCYEKCSRSLLFAFLCELTDSSKEFHSTHSRFHDSNECRCFNSAILSKFCLIWVS